MRAGVAPDRLAALYRDACRAELAALKPGNVHVHAPGHRMTVEDFETSAEVSAPHVARGGARVGTRVLSAVAATREAVGQNTNLGILLLAAPLLAAAERGGDLWEAVAAVLGDLDAADAADVFAAIRLAAPGGLGSAPEHDVAGPATDLRAAMAAAAGRDTIARQYVTDYGDVRAIGLPALLAAEASCGFGPQAVTALHLAWLAALPDSHVARKHGTAKAEAVRERVRNLVPPGAPIPPAEVLLDLDREWKQCSINPGTSADLTVATILSRHILRIG